ncbi:MAG TPA: isopentenyl-diphosphate Delta-isomerase [Thermomicrobiales bacterium]|jgi:isopentenyl-diphosphate delta-isomerase|nr:isopentenyl-diphosphate Delta-isomerase [Thermomicrobiales bacterium]
MNAPLTDHVVLVDEHNREIGTADKLTVHHAETPLHRGFSVFLFDSSGNLLLQQRSFGKKTWPGVWSNSCCGHIRLGESAVQAMRRRIHEELGIAGAEVAVLLPDYRYRYARDGVVENEFCPVAVGIINEPPRPNPDEVAAVRWTPWEAFLAELEGDSGFSEWSIEEARLLAADATFQAFLARLRRP